MILKTVTTFIQNIKILFKSKDQEQLRLKKSLIIISFVWLFVVLISLNLTLCQAEDKVKKLAENAARANVLKDQSFRHWVASHGGIYVPVTKETPPNPNLINIPYRDIEKPDGTKLTLMNPAYMLRHMVNQYPGLYGAKGKITSLKYLYEGNKPDDWETKALKSFEDGKKEALEYVEIDNKPFLRFMNPEYIKKSCLKCHAFQGYKVGDVRGGLGVTMPLQELYDITLGHNYLIIFGHLVLWFLVSIGILISAARESIHLHKNSKIQADLKESQTMLNEAQRIAHIGGWRIDLISKKLTLTDEVYNIIEADSNKQRSSHKIFFNAVHPDDRSIVTQSYFDSLSQKTPYNIIHRLFMKDGRIKYVKLSCETTYDENEKPLLSVGSIQDITESYLMQNELKLSNEFFQNLFEATPNIVITTNGKEIDRANTAMLEFFHCASVKDFKSKHTCICDLFVQCKDSIQAVMDDMSWLEYVISKPDVMHRACMMKNGKIHHFMVWAKPLIHDDRNYSIVTFADITELENAHQELKKQEKIMITQSRNAAMGEMISMIAHQWRQPISVIAMGANNILIDIELDSLNIETLKKEAYDIVNQTQELSKTIDDFRNFFQAEKTSESIRPENIFAKAFTVIGKSLENNGIHVVYEFTNDKNITTYSRELMQVFINILKNAIEALKESDIDEKKIFLFTQNTEDEITIRICDNAGGIKDDILEKIFDPYFTTKSEDTGTGLGLYMCKTIVENHLDGSIKAYNRVDDKEVNVGACFEISIPIELKVEEERESND